jgi:uncharacterized protein with HEPN domain
MAGMRDVLIHGYFAVNLEIVWDTVHRQFPRDKAQLREILDDLPSDA